MYTKITDPVTNIKYNINSRQGKNILRKYLNFLNGGASRTIVTAAISESGGNRNKSDMVLSIYPESFSKRHLNKYFNFEQHIRALSLPKIEMAEQVRIQTAIKREHFSVDEKIQLIELYIELMAHGDPERFAKYTTFLDSSKPNIVNQIKESLMVDLLSSIKSNESVAGSDIIRMSDIDILAGAESNIQATGHYYMKQLETVLNTDSSEEIIKQKKVQVLAGKDTLSALAMSKEHHQQFLSLEQTKDDLEERFSTFSRYVQVWCCFWCNAFFLLFC